MYYLLVSLIIVYTALGVWIYSRRPEAISNRALGIYLGLLLVATMGLLVVRSALAPPEAAFGARVALAAMAMANAVMLPCVIIYLYNSSRILNTRKVWLFALKTAIFWAVYLLGIAQGDSLVWPLPAGYGIVRTNNPVLTLTVLLSLAGCGVTVALVLDNAMRGNIKPGWLSGLYIVVLALGALIGWVLFVRLGDDIAGHPVGLATCYIPIIVLFLFQMERVKHRLPLPEVLRALLTHQADGALALDGDGMVVWAGESLSRLLDVPPLGTVSANHVSGWLGHSSVWPAIEEVLASRWENPCAECTVSIAGGERAVRVKRVQLDNISGYSRLAVLLFHDETAVVMRRALADRHRDIDALSAVSEAIASSLDPQEVMQTALEQILQVTSTDAVVVHLLENSGRLRRISAMRCDEDGRHVPAVLAVGTSVSREAIRQGKLVVASEGDPGFPALNVEGFRTMIAMPLLAQGRVLGAVTALDTSSRKFTPLEAALLEGIGRQVGVALENARLFQTLFTRDCALERLALLGLTLNRTMGELELLKFVSCEASAIFDMDGSIIWFVQEDEQELVAVASCSADSLVEQRLSIPLGVQGVLETRALDEQYPVYENQMAQKLVTSPFNWAQQMGIQSQVCAPLLRENVRIGVITLFSTCDPDRFSPADMETVNLLAAQVGLALQSTRQNEEIKRRLQYERLVNEVGRRATGILHCEALIRSVCGQIYEAFHYDIIAIFLILGEGCPELQSVFLDGKEVETASLAPDTLPMWAVRRAMELERAVCTSATLRVQADGAGKSGRTDLVLPLFMGHQVTGVLSVSRHQDDAVDNDEQEVLQILMAQLAVAISNARFFEQARQHRAELEFRVRERTAEIAAQRDQIEAILRSVGDAVVVTDLDGKIILANPPAANLLKNDEVAGKISRWMAGLDDQAEPETELALAEAVYHPTASPVMQGSSQIGTVVVLHDITRRHELDQLKSKFVAAVSHELRTPLTNIRLYISLLKQGRADRHKHYLEVVEREAMRLDGLVRDLLDLSRLEGQKIVSQCETVDIGQVIRIVVDNLKPQAEVHELTITYEEKGELPPVSAVRNQLVQLFTNLIANAIAYTDPGGQIWLRACSELDDGMPRVHIEIEDNGIGIPPEDLDHIFDRFHRSQNVIDRPGTGLGLAIVKEIVNLHNGTIDVHSEISKGSIFHITLPVGTLPNVET